jgi:hypothetical protein
MALGVTPGAGGTPHPWASPLLPIYLQTPVIPPPPQVWPPGQKPHRSEPPQPSLADPQFMPNPVQVLGRQGTLPQIPAIPPPPQV